MIPRLVSFVALVGTLAWGPLLAGSLKIATDQANLRTGAKLSYPIVDVVRRGEVLTPLAYQDGYVKVHRQGKEAWIYGPGQGWSEADIQAAIRGAGPAGKPASGTIKPSARPAPVSVPKTASDDPVRHALSLAALGLKDGHYFEGARSIHSQVFFFPLPADGSAGAGVLRLHYRTSGRINPLSNLRVDVNDKPVRSVSLGDQESGAWLDVPIGRDDLTKSAVKVTVRAALVATEDRCFDERSLALFFVHLMPDTRLDLTVPPGDGSLRAAFSRLPDRVRIAIPAQASGTGYAAALETAILLKRARHLVELVNLPKTGDIVIAPEAELSRLFGARGRTPADDMKNWGSIRLVRGPGGGETIAMSETLNPALLSRDVPAWLGLLKADAYLADLPLAGKREPPDRLDMLKLGLQSAQYVHRTVEWSMLLTPPSVRPDAWLETLRLNLVTPPESVAGKMLLYVYLNGTLQEVRPLAQDGQPHVESFSLSRTSQRAGANYLRIVIQRVDEEGDCRGDAAMFPVQFLPGSWLSVAARDEAPNHFNDLRATFAPGPELWITPASRARLQREIGLVSSLFANHDFAFRRDRLHFLGGNVPFQPKGPFILLGALESEPGQVAVHLNRGRVVIQDAEKNTLLALDHLAQISVAQLVRQGSESGLWLVLAQDGPLPLEKNLFLDQDDVAFLDERGVVLTLDSRQHALAVADYPDYFGWLDLAERYRFWIIGLGWTLLVVLLLHLYRKSRRHAGR